MQFDAWSAEVRRIVGSGGQVRADDLDPNAMYQAFAQGVSAEVFANSPMVTNKDSGSPIAPVSSVASSGAPVEFHCHDSHEDPHPAPSSPLSDSRASSSKETNTTVKWAALIGIPSLLLFMWLMSDRMAGTGAYSASLPVSGRASTSTASPAKPLAPREKLAKAKAAFAMWHGEGEPYVSSMTLLHQIPKGDQAKPEAMRLVATWKARKVKADARVSFEKRAAAAKAKSDAHLAAVASVRREREEARSYTGDGAMKVAIGKVELRHSTDGHYANRDSAFVFVNVSVKNFGVETQHVNPNDFTLADSTGNTASPDTDTYGLGNYFNAVNLSPNQQTSGWLVFLMRKDTRYTLTRSGMRGGGEVKKPVIP